MRTMFVALAWLVMTTPSIAAKACWEYPIPNIRLLPSEQREKAHKPINEVAEALLHDAETVYAEATRIVERKPQTDVESLASGRMEDLHDFGESYALKECHLQHSYDVIVKDYDYGADIDRMLYRVFDFDVYIFHAVVEARGCANIRAAAFLSLARQALDHVGTSAKDWKPDEGTVPDTHERCINDLSAQPREQLDKLVQDQIERYRKAASSGGEVLATPVKVCEQQRAIVAEGYLPPIDPAVIRYHQQCDDVLRGR